MLQFLKIITLLFLTISANICQAQFRLNFGTGAGFLIGAKDGIVRIVQPFNSINDYMYTINGKAIMGMIGPEYFISPRLSFSSPIKVGYSFGSSTFSTSKESLIYQVPVFFNLHGGSSQNSEDNDFMDFDTQFGYSFGAGLAYTNFTPAIDKRLTIFQVNPTNVFSSNDAFLQSISSNSFGPVLQANVELANPPENFLKKFGLNLTYQYSITGPANIITVGTNYVFF
jgi:hypothetical protein